MTGGHRRWQTVGPQLIWRPLPTTPAQAPALPTGERTLYVTRWSSTEGVPTMQRVTVSSTTTRPRRQQSDRTQRSERASRQGLRNASNCDVTDRQRVRVPGEPPARVPRAAEAAAVVATDAADAAVAVGVAVTRRAATAKLGLQTLQTPRRTETKPAAVWSPMTRRAMAEYA